MSQHVLRIGGREYRAEVKELTPGRATVLVDGKEYVIDLVQLGRRKVTGDMVRGSAPGAVPAAAPAPAAPPPGVAPPAGAPAPVAPPPSAPPVAPAAAPRPTPTKAGEGGIVAPMPGLILAMKINEGDTVQAGQALLVMEAMKMENAITSPYSGTVSKIYVRKGDAVGEGDLLVDVARPKMTTL
jgi:biotin carboxyl carrier protein